MGWPDNPRPAKALTALRLQVNARWPNRSKLSDGLIGDASHQTRDSDHNPWVIDSDGKRVVTALDITNDPAHGPSSQAIADALVASRDPRIKYVISNRRIANHEAVHGEAAWTWRPYFGKNPHDHHFHVSVIADQSLYDDAASWKIEI